jgi:hypothetical protein
MHCSARLLSVQYCQYYNMSDHAATVLIGWKTFSGSWHNFCASLWKGGENHKPPRFCIEVNVVRVGRKLAVLRLHHGATLQSAVEATVDLHCKTVCCNQLFGDVNIFSVVLSKNYYFFNVSLFKIKFTGEDCPPLLPLRSLHCFVRMSLFVHMRLFVNVSICVCESICAYESFCECEALCI